MRTCGDCTLCCLLTRVPELDKKEYQWCNHCTNGCTIYDDRPQSCRNFQCEWLKGEIPDHLRPNLCHVMIEKLDNAPIVIALVEPNYKMSEEVDTFLRSYQEKGISVVTNGMFCLLAKEHSIEEVNEYLQQAIKRSRLM